MADEDPVPVDGGSEAAVESPDAEPAKEGPPKPVDDAEQGQKIESDTLERHDVYHTTIHGDVHASSVSLGPSFPRRRRTGPLDPRALREARRFFHPPPRYDDALELIAMENLVVICGSEGSGRRCAAVALLDGPNCPGADRELAIELLEPQIPLDSLLDHGFARGGRYLQADYSLTVGEVQAQFEIEQLQRRLQATSAFLILTTDAAHTAFARWAIGWQPTTAADVFGTHLDSADIGATKEQMKLIHRVVAALPLARLAAFIDDLRSRGPDAACAPFGDHARSHLCRWLDGRPSVPDLVPIVTAALLPGAVEGEHERRATALTIAIDAEAGRDRSDADYVTDLRPSRLDRSDVVGRAPDLQRPGCHVVVIANELLPEVALRELHNRYGDELWSAVRDWLHDQPLDSDFRTTASLATGMAALGRVDLGLADEVLDRWASDSDDDRRWAAAVANSTLCADDRTVNRAWTQAIRWSRNTQPWRISAAHALSLNLSVHDLAQAVSRLWNLALGDAIVAIWARAELMAVTRRASMTEGSLPRLLAVIGRQLDHLAGAGPDGESLIDRSLTTVARVLAVRTSGDVPLTTRVLRKDSAVAPLLGHLWAQVLRSWPHRVAALDELYTAHLMLDGPATAALGEAIHRDLSLVEWQWLCRDLGFDLRVGIEAVEVVG